MGLHRSHSTKVTGVLPWVDPGGRGEWQPRQAHLCIRDQHRHGYPRGPLNQPSPPPAPPAPSCPHLLGSMSTCWPLGPTQGLWGTHSCAQPPYLGPGCPRIQGGRRAGHTGPVARCSAWAPSGPWAAAGRRQHLQTQRATTPLGPPGPGHTFSCVAESVGPVATSTMMLFPL